MISADRNLFLNLDEFATEHNIEGQMIAVVVDDDQLKELEASMDLAEANLLFRAKVEDLPQRREPGNLLGFDRKQCTIVDWAVDGGMATVILKQPRNR